MKNRTEIYEDFYKPFVTKHLGDKKLQNIIVTGNVDAEFERHNFLNYEKLISYDIHYDDYEYGEADNNFIIMDNVFSPKNPTESVNLIFFDGQWFSENDEEQQPKNLVKNLTSGIKRVLEGAFKNNKLGVVVVVYSDCIGIDNWVEDSLDPQNYNQFYEGIEIPFHLLKQNYGNYRVEDFFHKSFSFLNQDSICETSLSGAVFYER
tara:strand:+ start:179 stop:796 length:618 start_codon:yes stop_codon:yes gene_type:complete